MFIETIEVKGLNKKTASITFEKGLNVIAGASDTGKSYIVKCIQFILGSEEPPKGIDEAIGYTSLEVCFSNDDGSKFLLKRDLITKSKVVLVEYPNNNQEPITSILHPSHKGKKNLSEYFLNTFGLSNKFLVKGVESLNHSSLTLRVLSKLFLIDENRIITESSILGTGQNGEKTLEKSLLKTLLTGNDDSEVTKLKESKFNESNLKAKIQFFEEYLTQYYPETEDKEIESLDSEYEKLETELIETRNELSDSINSNQELVDKRRAITEDILVIDRLAGENKSLLDRFQVLTSKYNSDRERLVAGVEATNYLDAYILNACPTYGQELESKYPEMELPFLLESTFAEIEKIDSQLLDLKVTINDLLDEIARDDCDVIKNKTTLSSLNERINASISHKFKEYESTIAELLNKKKDFIDVRNNINKRNELLREIGLLQAKLDGVKNKYEMPDFSIELKELDKEISNVLSRWAFPRGEATTFDIDARDMIIGNKPRSHFGKGYRAIGYSAFAIGLMQYLFSKGRHPGFVVLDSPLTTYRKGDVDESEIEVSIEKDMIFAFYIDLCESYQDKQIIVFDNQEPEKDLISKMNYYHFSKNKNLGRYGFFQ
ncbi:MAG: hypothetical protein ACI88H_001635 [Cocleimonas sp.]|jgi:hypothetical protein